MTLPPASRGALAGLLAAALVVAGVAGLAAPAAAGGANVDRVTVEDDVAVAGTTKVHTVAVAAGGVNTSDGSATVELEFADWPDGAVGSVSETDVTLRSDDVELAGAPSVDGTTVRQSLEGADADSDEFVLEVDVELTHPASAPEDPYGVVATVRDSDDAALAGGGAAVRIIEEDLSVSIADGTVDSTGDGAQTTLTVDSNRAGSLDARVTAQGLDAADLYALFRGDENDAVERGDGAVVLRGLDPGASVPVDFEAVHPASYEFEVTATDTGASDTTAVTVEEREMDASFGKTVYEADAGDFVSFSVSFKGTGDGYVLVGGDRVAPGADLTNFLDVLYVGGGSTVTINTRLLGSDAPADEVYVSGGSVASYAHSPDHPAFEDLEFTDADGDVVAEDLEGFRRQLGIAGPSGPLRQGRYRLLAGTGDVVVREDGVPDFERPLARSNLFLTPPTYGNLTTYVAPEGKASETDSPGELRSSLTERTTVTKGDRLVFEFDATGFHGTLSWIGEGADPLSGGGTMHPSTLAELLDLPAGVTVEAVQRAPGPNRDATELDLGGASDGEAYFLAEDARAGGDDAGSTDAYYLVVDTRGTGPFDQMPEPGETYDFEVGFRAAPDGHYRFDRVDHAAKTASHGAVDHYPYLDPGGESELWTGNVTVEAPALGYDRTDAEGRPIVVNRSDATVSGRINYAPGTELSVQILPDNRTDRQPIAVQSVDVTENGTFEIRHDLAERAAGETLGLEFYVREELFDKRAVAVVDSPESFPAFDVVDAPDELAVGENGSTTLSTGVHNPGRLAGRERVELRVDGAVVDVRTLTVGGDETAIVEFEVQPGDRSPGTYDYSLVTPDDRFSGRLVVESPPDPDDPDESGTDPTPSGGNGSTSTPEETETPSGEDPEDGDDSGGLLGLSIPVGGRHAVGGAVIVGGAYVLDYVRESPEVLQRGVATVQALLRDLLD